MTQIFRMEPADLDLEAEVLEVLSYAFSGAFVINEDDLFQRTLAWTDDDGAQPTNINFTRMVIAVENVAGTVIDDAMLEVFESSDFGGTAPPNLDRILCLESILPDPAGALETIDVLIGESGKRFRNQDTPQTNNVYVQVTPTGGDDTSQYRWAFRLLGDEMT